MKRLKKLRITNKDKVTLGDALIAYQMGYRAKVKNGRLVEFIREAK
jgi:hypothetical protein